MSTIPNETTFAIREDVAEALIFLGYCSPGLGSTSVAMTDAWYSVLSSMFIPPSAPELIAAVERVAQREPLPAVAHLCREIESMRRLSAEVAAAAPGAGY